jgi:LPS sulfotransferase NodH
MSDRRNFVILFQGRAGSSFLVDALGRLPGVVAEGEMLVGVDPSQTPFGNRLRRLFRPAADDGPAHLQLIWTRNFYRREWPGARAVGFKTKVRDVYDRHGFGRMLEEEDVHVLVLERRNLIKQAVSNLNAERVYAEHGVWNLRHDQQRPGPFEADPERFDAALRRVVFERETLDAFVRFVRRPMLRLEYEGLVRDPRAWFGAACEFLGLPAGEPVSDMRKATDDDLRRVVTNLAELRSRYEGSHFEAMFNDALAVVDDT